MAADMVPVATATGMAWRTVQEHQEQQQLALYSSWFCPFAQRVWIALEAKALQYKYVEIDPYNKSPEFLALNPRGLVPVLGHGRRLVYESLIVMEYLEDAFHAGPRQTKEAPSPSHHALLPPDPWRRAYVRIWTDHVSKKVVPPFYQLLQSQHTAGQIQAADALLSALKDWLLAFLPHVSSSSAGAGAAADSAADAGSAAAADSAAAAAGDAMDSGDGPGRGGPAGTAGGAPVGPYFEGRELGFADIALAPFALRIDPVLGHFRGFAVPGPSSTPTTSSTPNTSASGGGCSGAGADGSTGPGERRAEAEHEAWRRYHAWLAAVKAHPAVAATLSDAGPMLAVYQRYADNTASSEVAKATRTGSGLP